MEKGILFAVLAVLQWGALGIFIKNIESINSIGIVTGRLFFGSIILFFIIISKTSLKQNLISSLRSFKFYLIVSLIMSLHFIFATMGYYNTTIANAALLTNSMPLFVPFLAFFFLSEKIRSNEIVGIIIALLGIVIIFSSKDVSLHSSYLQGNIWALIAAILLAIYTIIGRKYSNKYSPIITTFWICTIGSVITYITSVFTQSQITNTISYSDIVNLIGLGLVGTFGHLCYFISLNYIKATTASVIAMSSPVVAMIYAATLISETYTMLNIIGIFICLCGIAITVKNRE